MKEYPARIDCGDFEMIKPDVTFENAARLFAVVNRNRAEFSKWFGWVDFIKSAEDEFAQIQSVARPDACKYLLQSGNKFIGNVGVVQRSVTNKMAEIGYWLDIDARGHGVMTRAVSQMQRLLFNSDDVIRIQIRAAVENVRSCAVAQRLGYVKEGVMRQAEVVRDGLVQDIVVYSKLKSEWERGK